MRNPIIYLSALASLSFSSALRHGSSQIRDLVAFPKYEVRFLNDLPLAASDADRCQALGIEREDEFLMQRVSLTDRRRLSDGTDAPSQDRLELIPMSLTPPDSDYTHEYLCLMPSANTTAAQIQSEEVEEHGELDPAESWAALSHLDGRCLYSKQGWFTYSYCHNSHIRQFREARHAHPHPPGGYVPLEDASFDAYTLGQAHPNPQAKRPRASLPPQTAVDQVNEQSVSFGLGASTRYLVQRWSDGTPCDKTGRPREVEVQVHCSMTTGDTIYMVKEMAICQYVLIIHSPHLCSLPGFKAENVDVEPAGIRCREVVRDDEWETWREGGTETLRLPLARPGVEAAPIEQAVGVPNLEDNVLRDILRRVLETIGDKKQDIEAKDDVVLLSWQEREDGTVLLDADLLVAGDEAEGKKKLGGQDKEMILKVVREYLDKKENDEEEKRTRDEL